MFRQLFTVAVIGSALALGACESDNNNTDSDYQTRPHSTDTAARPTTTGVKTTAPSTASNNSSTTTQSTTHASGQLSEFDRNFIMEAASGGLFEVQSAQLALDRNTDPQIRQMASMLVEDHTKANSELKAIAQKKGIQIPQQLAQREQQMMNQMRDQQGAEFARQFQNVQEQAHRDAITLFDRYAREGNDPELKAFAQKTLPVLRKHMDHVQQYRPSANMQHNQDVETTPR